MTKEEFMTKVKTYVGENADDATLTFIEDMDKAYDDVSGGEWKKKFEENDTHWREKYKATFFGKKPEPEDPHVDEFHEKGFNDLFKK